MGRIKVAVLSGKGGAGKTFVSVSLAQANKSFAYVDCDVEEPNGNLFFNGKYVNSLPVSVKVPVFDDALCTGCRQCVDFCNFNALFYINGRVKLFEHLCHNCGGCVVICPVGAVTERERIVGKINHFSEGETDIITGILNIGEASGVKLIESVIDYAQTLDKSLIIDCPPGSACPVNASIKSADYCLLVAEPTAFGLHNFKMVHKLVNLTNKPCGVLINKTYGDDDCVLEYCRENNIEVVGRIPYSEKIAKKISDGNNTLSDDEDLQKLFLKIINKINHRLSKGSDSAL